MSNIRELPDMMSADFWDFLTPSPLSAFGSDLYYKITITKNYQLPYYIGFSMTLL